MTTNISGDIRINGRDEVLTSTIKTPLGFKTEIQGTVNIVDRSSDLLEPNDIAKLQINGKTVHDSRSIRYINDATGIFTLTATDDIVVFTDNGTGNLGCVLPLVEDVHPKQYVIQFEHVSADGWRAVSVDYLNATTVAKRDNFNGRGWVDLDNQPEYHFHKPGSIYIQSELGTYPGQGSTNNWRIIGSHNQSDINGTYKREVKINAGIDGNQTLANLVVGYTLNGYTLALGDRILLDRQTDPIENGIYVLADATEPALRAHDLAPDTFFTQAIVHSTENKKEFRILSEGKVDTDAITVLQTKGHRRVDNTQPTIGTAFDADGDHGVLTTVSLTTGAGSSQPFTLNNLQHEPAFTIAKISIANYTGAGYPVVTMFDTTGNGVIDFSLRNLHGSLALNAPIEFFYEILHTLP